MKIYRWLSLLVFCAIVGADRLSKAWAITHLVAPYHSMSWCTFVLAHNTGIAWSIGSTAGYTIRLIMLSIITGITIACIGTFCRAFIENRRYTLALSMIAAGALSNLYDRYTYGAVIDFILLHYAEYSWPIFNIADLSICIGAALWWLQGIRPCR
jgi:signal peptidase II